MFSFIFIPPTLHAEEWNEPLEKADLLLFSSHADDEHLFFAGVLPYCAANGIAAQVVYMTNHNDNPVRNTELLNGLWAVGVRNKPVISRFPDLFSESLAQALQAYRSRGISQDDFTVFCVENIRRFKPQAAVGHDVNGEYGHGTHMMSAIALMKAVGLAGDESFHSESFSKYGVWDTPKTYIFLWNERRIVLSINEPLPFFDGKTAFQVSQFGFTYHKSQHWTWFNGWLNGTAQAPITRSTQIRRYQPGNFGLYRTLVGDDSEGAVDFFENITLIKDIIEEDESEAEGDFSENAVYFDESDNYNEADNPENGQQRFWRQYLRLFIPAIIIIITIALLLSFFLKKNRK